MSSAPASRTPPSASSNARRAASATRALPGASKASFARSAASFARLAAATSAAAAHSTAAAAGAAAAEALLVPLSPDKIPLAPGQAPPEGFRLLRAEEAAAERWRGALVAGWLEEWSIVRLEGGKIDGRGYGGGVTAGDFTQDQYIGEALVVPLAEETGEGSATP